MTDRIVDRATEVIKPIVESMGYVFVDLEYKKDFSGYVLALTIDKPEGVNINDCEAVSRALDIPLDENDFTNGNPYNFNVSSYGLDRPLKNEYDFNKHIGKFIDIKFYVPFNGLKSMTATLVSFDDNSIDVEFENNAINIERKVIAHMCAHLDF